MTDQELRKLRREELLQIMIAQSRRITALKNKLEETEKKLHSKEIELKEAGNIAEAALKLNRIFEDAQAAADQYLYNIKLRASGKKASKKARKAEPVPEEAEKLTEEEAYEADSIELGSEEEEPVEEADESQEEE